MSATVIRTILGGFAIAAALVRVVLPMIAAYLKEWALIAGAMAATAVLFAIYPFLHSALAMGLCSVLLGMALGTVQPMIMSTLHQITPEARHGEAIALRIMAINASSVAMPLLFGVAGAVVGISGVFWVVGLAVGAGTRLALGLKAGRTP
jgi:sugar phosphate permease